MFPDRVYSVLYNVYTNSIGIMLFSQLVLGNLSEILNVYCANRRLLPMDQEKFWKENLSLLDKQNGCR